VLCGSATGNIGVDLLMDFMVTCLPITAGKCHPNKGVNPANEEVIERARIRMPPFPHLFSRPWQIPMPAD
jgi:elongation factor G